ncbi:MAG TPA: tocopherol cyclase family protein [Bdellovibrionota bacterium]|nr:tocopherol cyclase family protein [Bdellovibrionota bacterium]
MVQRCKSSNGILKSSSQLSEARFTGQYPFYEVWYGKLNFDKEKALWFRYTLLNGVKQECAVWAIFFNGSKITASKKKFPLSHIKFENNITLPAGALNIHHVNGNVGNIQWDLAFQHEGETFDPVPTLFKKLHLTKSLVTTPVLNAQFKGKIEVEGAPYVVQDAPGMIGHIWGQKQALEWTWCHCNQFVGEHDVVFEGLSAKIPILKWKSPPLTSLYLKYEGDSPNGKTHVFNSVRNLISAQSTYGYGEWSFSAKNKEISLKGLAQSLPQHIAVITYRDTDDTLLYCHNSKLANLELHVEEFKTGKKYTFKSEKKAALEWVTREGFQGKKYL